MPKFDYDLIVLGGGSAGLSLSSIAARFGAKVALIDAEDLGGDCLHYGCVPSKTFIHAAKVAHLAKIGGDIGINVSDVNVDFAAVMQRVQTVIQTIADHVDNADRFRSLGCDVWTQTRGKFVDEHTVDVGDRKITGKKIAICVGTRPNTIPVEGLDQVDYLTNETVFNLREQPQTLGIFGAGPIGSELAQAFQRLGTQVTIFNRNNCVLDREDDDVSHVMCEVFKREGVSIEKGITLQKVEQSGNQTVIHFERDGTSHQTSVDKLLVAVGRKSNADSISAEAAGVGLDERGFVKTNDKLQTSQPHIFAAGDVSGHLQFTHYAGYEAGIVFRNALLPFLPKAKINLDQIPWTTFTDPEVASTGLNEKACQKQNIDYTVTKFPFSHQDRALAENETEGFVKLVLGKKDKLHGVQIVGPNAGELIHEWIVARNFGIKLSKLSSMVHVYPTLSGIAQQTAGDYLGKKFFTAKNRRRVRTWLGYRNVSIDEVESTYG